MPKFMSESITLELMRDFIDWLYDNNYIITENIRGSLEEVGDTDWLISKFMEEEHLHHAK